MLSTLEAHIVAIVTSAVSIVIGLGVLSPASGGHLVAIVGSALSGIFVVVNEIKGLSLAKAGLSSKIK